MLGSPNSSPAPPLHHHPLPPLLSVHDLLDHTWHYECVVSPTYSTSTTNPATPSHPCSCSCSCSCSSSSSSSTASSSPPNPKTTPAPTFITTVPSQYVSLSSFLHPASTTTTTSNLHSHPHSSSKSPTSSKCRGAEHIRKSLVHPTYVSSSSSSPSSRRAAFSSPFLDLDY